MLKRFSRILIVDDSPVMLKLVRHMLSGLGFDNVHCTADGLQAQGMMRTARFQLIICDWQMAPVNGLELYRYSRSSQLNSNTPFLIMTGYAIKFASISRENGNISYISKPFDASALSLKLQQVAGEVAA